MNDLQVAADKLTAANDYTDIFGTNPATTVKQVGEAFRRFSRILHPDQYSGTDAEMAASAMAALTKFKADADAAHADGRFGHVPVVISTKHGRHVVGQKLAAGDITDLFKTDTGLLKVARSARDNDLLAAEATTLKTLHSFDNALTRHYPQLVDTFIYRADAPRTQRRANVVTWVDGPDLVQIREAFPTGVDPRHVAWIWRRLLMALGFAHDCGVLHGAVLPPHIMILPEHHGVILVDWCYSTQLPIPGGDVAVARLICAPPIKAILPDYRTWYPEEVTDKKPPSPATDIVMAARTMIWLLGGDPTTGQLSNSVPRGMRAWFKGCLQTKQSMRPDDAGKLLAEFDELLERIGEPYHPRRWIDFVVPPGPTR